MSYIEKLINGDIVPGQDQITLDEYLRESLYITKYLSPRIKATNIATYHAMFYLSYGVNGIGEFSIPWPEIGALCGNERGSGTITKNEAVRERTKILTELGCIKISQNRTGANDFTVVRPSQIPFVVEALNKENETTATEAKAQSIDCYNDSARRIKILERDSSTCVYCLASLTPESYYLDHIQPRAKGGSNYKNNLVSSCQDCNANKSDSDVWDFLTSNYRKGLLTQSEYLAQKSYLEGISNGSDTSEP